MKVEKKNNDPWDTYNSDHHVPYTDDEIELILKSLPVPKNCIALGKVLKRSQGAIKQVFEKAYMPHAEVKHIKKNCNRESQYNKQIQKTAKKLKLIKGYNVFKYSPKRDKKEEIAI